MVSQSNAVGCHPSQVQPRDLIRRYPMHLSEDIAFYPPWRVGIVELCLLVPTRFGSIEEAKQDLKIVG